MGGIDQPGAGPRRLRQRRRNTTNEKAPRDDVSLGALLELLQDGVALFDPDGLVLDCNQRFLDILDLERERVVGASPPYPWWPPERDPSLGGEIEAQLQDGRAHYELEFVRGGGERFPGAVDVAMLDGKSNAAGFLGVLHDLTEEVAERRRRHDAERVARLATWEWDPATDLMSGSTGLLDRAEVSSADRHTLAGVLSYVPTADADRLRAQMEEVAAGEREEFSIEIPVRSPNPEIGWLEVRGQPLRDEAGKIARVRGVTQDITERRRADEALGRSRELLSAAERLADVGSFESDDRTGRSAWSENLYRLFGIAPDSFSHRLVDGQKVIWAADRGEFLRVRDQVLGDGVPRMVEHRYTRGEEVRWAETRLEPLRDEGEIVGIRGTLQDITERRRAEEEARLHAHLLDAVETAVVTVGLDGIITHWNTGAERLYGWRAEEAIGEPVTMLAADQGERSRAREMIRRVEQRGGKLNGEFKIRRKDGAIFTALVQSSFYADEHGEPAGIVGTAVDLTERVDHEERLRAARDYLRAVTDSIGEGVYTLDERGRVSYANPATQRILGWTAEELMGKVMHNVTHFRHADGSDYRREECPTWRTLEEREVVHVEDDMFIAKDGTEVPVEYTASPIETDGAGGSVIVFSDISDRKRRQLELDRQLEALSWVERIRDALDHDHFEVFAQPIVDLRNGGEAAHHELLIRMRGADGELIAPGRFLPIAEQHSVIGEIDRWMIGQAADLAGAGHAVHVNLSAQSVGRSEVTDTLVGALRRTGADPALVVIELTETALLENEAEAERFTQQLRQIGCRLALDDFGTGYGGFSYLKRLSVDYLKIDREFVADLTDNDASRHVVTAVINLAKGFGQETVAEGIEDQATLDLLRALGVDYAQGFHIARPAPVADVLGRG
jgi:PAS domain S-box-containing protein